MCACKTRLCSLYLPQTGGDEVWHKPFSLLPKPCQIISKTDILEAGGRQAGSSTSPAGPCECPVSACSPATQTDAVLVASPNRSLLLKTWACISLKRSPKSRGENEGNRGKQSDISAFPMYMYSEPNLLGLY